MAFFRCKREDPFTRMVRERYAANIVRGPRAGIDPLDVVAKQDNHVEIRGDLAPLIEGGESLILPGIDAFPAPDISGSRSVDIDVSLAAELSAKFLGALGIPIPGASIDLSVWKGATSFSFEVRDVRERRVDINALGASLRGRKVIRTQPAAAIFFEDHAQMLIITRTLTSPRFAIRGKSSGGQSVDVSIDAISDLIGKASTKVEWKRESTDTVSFRGSRSVTFALAATPCNLRPDGSFTFGLELRDTSYLNVPTEGGEPVLLTRPLPLVNEDGLLDVE